MCITDGSPVGQLPTGQWSCSHLTQTRLGVTRPQLSAQLHWSAFYLLKCFGGVWFSSHLPGLVMMQNWWGDHPTALNMELHRHTPLVQCYSVVSTRCSVALPGGQENTVQGRREGGRVEREKRKEVVIKKVKQDQGDLCRSPEV